MSHPHHHEPTDAQKHRRGLQRMAHALRYSRDGLRTGLAQTAFRQECLATLIMLPLAFWLGRNWLEVAVLAGSVWLVLVVELLNSAVEAAIDRIGPERHPLSKQAKDMGSAAVLLSLMLVIAVWCAALWARWIT